MMHFIAGCVWYSEYKISTGWLFFPSVHRELSPPKKSRRLTSDSAAMHQCGLLPAACSAPRSSWTRRPTAPGSCPPTPSCWRTGTESPWCSERRWTWAGPTPGSLLAGGCSGGPSQCARSSCGGEETMFSRSVYSLWGLRLCPLAVAKVKHLLRWRFVPLDGLWYYKSSNRVSGCAIQASQSSNLVQSQIIILNQAEQLVKTLQCDEDDEVKQQLTFSWSSAPSLLSAALKPPPPASSFLCGESGCSRWLWETKGNFVQQKLHLCLVS